MEYYHLEDFLLARECNMNGIYKEIVNHAEIEYPNESCGFIIENNDKEVIYFPVKNVSSSPKLSFEINTRAFIEVEEIGDITSIVHSHPKGNLTPSISDFLSMHDYEIEWVITADKKVRTFRPMPFLPKRNYLHGTFDCYSLIRDAYHLGGIYLPDFEREDVWWETSANLYADNIKNYFYEIDKDIPLNFGDIILICAGSTKPTHSALYIGDNLILHHFTGRLSSRELYAGYWHKHTHSIWRHPEWQSLDYMAILNNMAAHTKYQQRMLERL